MYINKRKLVDLKRYAPHCYTVRYQDESGNLVSESFVNTDLERLNIKSVTRRGTQMTFSFITNPQRMKRIYNVHGTEDLIKILQCYKKQFELEKQYDMLNSVKSSLKIKDGADAVDFLSKVHFTELQHHLAMRYRNNFGARIRTKLEGRLTKLFIDIGACEYVPDRFSYPHATAFHKDLEKKCKRHRIFIKTAE